MSAEVLIAQRTLATVGLHANQNARAHQVLHPWSHLLCSTPPMQDYRATKLC